MAALGQTIMVVNKSGKVVSTSKHLINVFKEAKAAYQERKAEIVADRTGKNVHQAKAVGRAYTIEESSAPTSPRSPQGGRRLKDVDRRPTSTRRHSGSSMRSGASSIYPESNHRFEHSDLRSPDYPRSPHGELVRRSTSRSGYFDDESPPRSPARSNSVPDLDLAYGELPPDLVMAKYKNNDEMELKEKISKVKLMLDEAHCVQYSVTSVVASLQKNPEAMAAVALTLAEISNLATKMAPGALMALKSSAPAVFALLLSPEFLIAGGVAVGVTVVAFGGYKIIKKIKANKKAKEDPGMDEMLEIGGDLSRIENWRRGISDAAASSVGTSVEGEFITPQALSMSNLNLQDERLKDSQREGRILKETMRSPKAIKASKTSKASSRSSKSSKTIKPEKEKKEKKPSPLRLMFS